jgi:hypothetical protein
MPGKHNLVLLLVLMTACGKRGDPRPPVPLIPRATTDLVVTQRGARVLLSWSYPALTTSGASLRDIRRVVVYRYSENLPAAASPAVRAAAAQADTATLGQPSLFSTVPILTPVQFLKLREKIDSIDGANLKGATVGSRLTYEDKPPLAGPSSHPIRLTYAVVTEGATARSDSSNLASIVPVDVAIAPSGLQATPRPEGVALAWTASEKSISGTHPSIAGYDIYRLTPGEKIDTSSKPVNGAPVKETTYLDVPPFGTYRYAVSAVSSVDEPRIESEPSEEAQATYKDLLPPPPPKGLTALIEDRAVRLVWDPVDAPDLLGYRIYRSEGKVRLTITKTPIPQTNFTDISVVPGTPYDYGVTSIDKSGNESAPSMLPGVLVPRTR